MKFKINADQIKYGSITGGWIVIADYGDGFYIRRTHACGQFWDWNRVNEILKQHPEKNRDM